MYSMEKQRENINIKEITSPLTELRDPMKVLILLMSSSKTVTVLQYNNLCKSDSKQSPTLDNENTCNI